MLAACLALSHRRCCRKRSPLSSSVCCPAAALAWGVAGGSGVPLRGMLGAFCCAGVAGLMRSVISSSLSSACSRQHPPLGVMLKACGCASEDWVRPSVIRHSHSFVCSMQRPENGAGTVVAVAGVGRGKILCCLRQARTSTSCPVRSCGWRSHGSSHQQEVHFGGGALLRHSVLHGHYAVRMRQRVAQAELHDLPHPWHKCPAMLISALAGTVNGADQHAAQPDLSLAASGGSNACQQGLAVGNLGSFQAGEAVLVQRSAGSADLWTSST